MRVAALYDIHGNLPALEAVLEEIQSERIDRIVVGGDVLPGPMPGECLDRLRQLALPVDYIIGNGDRETVAARRGEMSSIIPPYFRESMHWNAAQLSDAEARDIAGWPLTRQLRISGLGNVLFCHATPRNDLEIFTRDTDAAKLSPIFELPGVDVVVCGHTHMQFDRRVGRVRVINAGSVGMPFQAPGAYWLLLDEHCSLRKTDYDLGAAAARIRATSYPLAEDFAAKNVLCAPDESSMIEAFSKAELG
jgi:putative phosphoesterase